MKFDYDILKTWRNLEILDTDYKTYSIVYYKDHDYVKILTRKPLDPRQDFAEVSRIRDIADKVLSEREKGFIFGEKM